MTLDVANFSQIMTLLTQLSTNYTNIFTDYYNVFYNPEPMDITLQFYDQDGNLEEITIPNRAKDRAYIITGEGDPNGSISGDRGTLYQDLANGAVYVNIDGSLNGWTELFSEASFSEMFIKGGGSPEGVVTASKGVIYIDTENAVLYIKTTDTGNTGWTLVTASTSILATTDLDNLTEEGEAHFANPALSNLNSTGQALMNSKEDKSNKVSQILGTEGVNQYPTARAVYTFTNASIETAIAVKEDKDNKVTTITASSTDIEYPSAKAVYIYGKQLVPDQLDTKLKILSSSGSDNSWINFYDYFNTLPSSGTIALTNNSLNAITPTDAVIFTLPVVTDPTILNQILVQIDLSTLYSIDVGTTHFFNGKAPDLSTAGSYNLIYEYDEITGVWVCGWMRKS